MRREGRARWSLKKAAPFPGAALFYAVIVSRLFLIAEITVEESLETAAVTGFVLGHFVNGVVDCIEVGSLGVLGDAHLVGVGTGLGVHTLLEVGLGVPNDVTEELGELCGVLGFFPSVALESLGDFGMPSYISIVAKEYV